MGKEKHSLVRQQVMADTIDKRASEIAAQMVICPVVRKYILGESEGGRRQGWCEVDRVNHRAPIQINA